MQRRAFFIFLWKKRVYPLLLFLLLLLGIRFVANAWAGETAERFALLILLVSALLALLLFYAGRLGKRLWQKLQSIVPQKLQPYLRASHKLLNMLALLLLGAMFYHYWEKDRWLLLFFGGYLAVKTWVELLAAEQKKLQAGE